MQNAKYYSVILNCTPDVGKPELMNMIIRFVSCSKENVKIKENFLSIVEIFDSTSHVLCAIIRKMLEVRNIPIANMRGQGFEKGGNIKGDKNRLKNTYLKVNSRAFFVLYTAHSLNFTINNALKVNLGATFFPL